MAISANEFQTLPVLYAAYVAYSNAYECSGIMRLHYVLRLQDSFS
jgi:hypothetical protein